MRAKRKVRAKDLAPPRVRKGRCAECGGPFDDPTGNHRYCGGRCALAALERREARGQLTGDDGTRGRNDMASPIDEVVNRPESEIIAQLTDRTDPRREGDDIVEKRSSVVKKKVAGAGAPAARAEKKPTATRKPPAKGKTEKKPAGERTSRRVVDASALKPTTDRERAQAKACRELEVGKSYPFSGRDETLRGTRVKVVGFMRDGGVYVDDGKGTRTCTPWALGVEKPGAKERAEKKAAKKSAVKKKTAVKKKAD